VELPIGSARPGLVTGLGEPYSTSSAPIFGFVNEFDPLRDRALGAERFVFPPKSEITVGDQQNT